MTIQQNFPGIMPSLNLNFAKSKRLDQRVTFQRQTGATVTNELGLIERVGNNIPRFDHSYDSTGAIRSLGLLIEEQRENLINYSNDYSSSPGGWTLSSTGTRAQDIVGPDGVVNSAWTITDNSSAGDLARFYKQISIAPSLSTNYCVSSFVKDINGTGISPEFYVFLLGSSTKGSRIVYNFSTDTITASSSDGGGISPSIYGRILYPNGWVRIYFVVNDANDGGNNTLQYRIYPNGRDVGRTGAMGFYGSQIEVGAFPTSYIPTQGLPVTRLADNAYIDGENFTSFYNQVEGTVFTSFRRNTNDSTVRVFNIDDGTNTNRISGLASDVFYQTYVNPAAAGPTATFSETDTYKVASGHQDNNVQVYVNGSYQQSNTSITIPKNLNTFRIGNWHNNTFQGTTISQLIYYPRRLTNNQLQQLTR